MPVPPQSTSPGAGAPRVLHVTASPRGEESVSTRVARAFLDECAARSPGLTVDTLDVWDADLPEFDPSGVAVKYKMVSGADLDEHESRVHDQVRALIDRVRAADRLVLSSPMWNWSVPYKLKHFIDVVSQRDALFTYDGQRYGPALDLEHALLVCVRGQGRGTPTPTGPDREHHVEYLRFWCETIGARRVEVIDVDHTWDDRADETLAHALTEARGLATALDERPGQGR